MLWLFGRFPDFDVLNVVCSGCSWFSQSQLHPSSTNKYGWFQYICSIYLPTLMAKSYCLCEFLLSSTGKNNPLCSKSTTNKLDKRPETTLTTGTLNQEDSIYTFERVLITSNDYHQITKRRYTNPPNSNETMRLHRRHRRTPPGKHKATMNLQRLHTPPKPQQSIKSLLKPCWNYLKTSMKLLQHIHTPFQTKKKELETNT